MSDEQYKTGQCVNWINESGRVEELRYIAGLWSDSTGSLWDGDQLASHGWYPQKTENNA